MSITHTVIRSYRDESGVILTGSTTVTDDSSLNTSVTVAISTTNHEVDWAAVRANLQSLCIYASQPVTIKTNSSGSPTDTITMTAGQELNWSLSADTVGRCPFSADVTKLFLTNSSATLTVQVEIRAVAHLGN